VRISRTGPPKGPGGGPGDGFEPGPEEESEGGFNRVSMEDICWFFQVSCANLCRSF